MPDLTLQPRVWTDQLAKRLPRITDSVHLQRIVAESAHLRLSRPARKGFAMALADKMKRLAERSTSVPKSLEAWADQHLAKLDALEQRGSETFGKLGQVMDNTEAGIAAAEDALNQLTNGAPEGPLPG